MIIYEGVIQSINQLKILSLLINQIRDEIIFITRLNKIIFPILGKSISQNFKHKFYTSAML